MPWCLLYLHDRDSRCLDLPSDLLLSDRFTKAYWWHQRLRIDIDRFNLTSETNWATMSAPLLCSTENSEFYMKASSSALELGTNFRFLGVLEVYSVMSGRDLRTRYGDFCVASSIIRARSTVQRPASRLSTHSYFSHSLFVAVGPIISFLACSLPFFHPTLTLTLSSLLPVSFSICVSGLAVPFQVCH